MKAHPVADLLPLLEGEAFDSLVADIQANGLLEPITIHEGLILDGRNRWNACKAAGVEPQFLEFDGDDPLAFVLSLNVHRRHLSESQRGMVAARLETLKRGDNQHKRGDANLHVPRADAAKRLNVSSRTVASAAAVRDRASPELIQAVERGDIAVSVAAGLATASEEFQRQAVAKPDRAHVLVKQAARAERESELGAKQLALPVKRYGVIYADPPWRFEVYSRDTGLDRDASNHYPVQTLEQIKTLAVAGIAAPDCVLFLWATGAMMPQALEVMAAWKFEYRSQFVWAKDRAGTGYWNRNQHELLLVGTRGDVPAPAPGAQWASLIEAPVGPHSAKPKVFAEMIEGLFPTLPKIELFARGKARPGWDVWGAEAE
jgi:N6-adenosine-specific RNA methylase IME4